MQSMKYPSDFSIWSIKRAYFLPDKLKRSEIEGDRKKMAQKGRIQIKMKDKASQSVTNAKS